MAERIVASIQQPCPLGDMTVRTSVSVGIAHHHIENETTSRNHLHAVRESQTAGAEQLIKLADSAMYVAKASGKGQAVDAERALDSTTVGAPVAGRSTP